METILGYIYQTWRLEWYGYGMVGLGITLAIIFIIAIIIAIHDSGRER